MRRFSMLSIWVLLFTMAGVLIGFLREVLLAKYYGVSPVLEALRVSFALPNMFGQSLGGIWVACFLPMVHSSSHPSHAKILQFTGASVVLITLIGLVTTPYTNQLLAPGLYENQMELMNKMGGIFWLGFLFLGLGFGLRVFCHHKEIFLPSAASSIILSLSFVLGIIMLGSQGDIFWLSWWMVGGAIVILCLYIIVSRPFLAQYMHVRDIQSWQTSPSTWVLFSLISALIGYHFLQNSYRFIDRYFASYDSGMIAYVEYAYALLNVPAMLLGSSFSMLLYPTFTRALQQQDAASIRRIVVQLMQLCIVSVLCIPGYYLFGKTAIALIFERGAFTAADTDALYPIVAAYIWVLPALIATIVLSQSLVALKKVPHLVIIALCGCILKIILLAFFLPFWPVQSYGISTALVLFLTALVMAMLLYKQAVSRHVVHKL